VTSKQMIDDGGWVPRGGKGADHSDVTSLLYSICNFYFVVFIVIVQMCLDSMKSLQEKSLDIGRALKSVTLGRVVAIVHSKYQLQTPLTCYIFYLSSIFFFLKTLVQKLENNMLNIVIQACKQ
jgi:hypothetical protein